MTKIGTVSWFDLTVPDAESIREFYSDVVGWMTSDVDMGGYSDYTMIVPDTEQGVAGVCHARGTNAELPPQWLIYINVADLDHSIERCNARGGAVIAGPKVMSGYGRYCVI